MRIPQLLTTLIAAGTLLAGCYKQPDLVPPVADRDQTLTLRAVLEDGAQTKVDISSATGAATWTDGDQVAYCITDGSSTRYNTSPVDVGTGRISLSLPAGYRRTGLAFYPAAARGTDPADPTAPAVHYPDTYDLSGKNAETWAPCPMIALNTESELHFYHVGGLLRLHLGAIPGGTRSLRLTFRGVDYVTGTFTVSGAGTTAAACTKAGTDGGNVLTFTLGESTDFPASTFLNVPLPGADYTSLKEILIHCLDADGTTLCTLEKYLSDGTTVDRAEGLMVHLGAGNRKMHDFSVAAGRRVLFSPGNLQATTTDLGASWTWAFAANQWSVVGNAAGNNSINGVGTVSTNGTVDLFGWNGKSSSNNSYGINNSTSDANYGNNASDVLKTDWGSIPEIISTLGTGWRTLSSAEWVYLFDTRTTTFGVRYAKATVNGVTGMILLPDDWSASYYALASTNTAGAAYTANTISLSDWTSKLEDHGAIFLPAAGYRDGTSSYDVGSRGNYWSSTANSTTHAYNLNFGSESIRPQGYNTRHFGFSVRLVRDANPFLFSISDSAKAEFSPGNLQYQASTDTWRFAEHQWDYIGAANASISSNYSGWIDLFGWGTSGHKFGSGYGSAYQPYSTSTTVTDYGPTDGASGLTGTYKLGDWGVKNAIGSYPAGTWRTLTNAEWGYLFNTRTTTSGIRYAKAKVNGVAGIILLPDNWSASYYALASTNTADAAFTANTISLSDWTSKLEAHGAVFLPAAGFRNGINISLDGSSGYYWSGTAYSNTNAYQLYFLSSGVNPQRNNERHYGFAVRLVR